MSDEVRRFMPVMLPSGNAATMIEMDFGRFVLAEDYDRLRAALADANTERNEQARLLGMSAETELKLRAALAERERDAERYRWLRENGKEMTYDALLEIIEEYGERADAKLDAAILAAKGEAFASAMVHAGVDVGSLDRTATYEVEIVGGVQRIKEQAAKGEGQ